MTKLERSQSFFVLLWAASLLVWWRPLVSTFALSMGDDEYTQILLILPISAALIYLERRPLRTMIAMDVRGVSFFFVAAVLFTGSAFDWPAPLPADEQLSIRMAALVLSWIGAFVLCFGLRSARLALFPLCFLVGLIPIPRAILDPIVVLLQQGSAWSAHALFATIGVPVAQDGVELTIPGLTLQVAGECSSIRSSSMLLVTALVLAQLLLRSPWRKALVIALAIPLSVAKNGLRIFTIAMLGTRVDPGYMTGRLHHQGGIVFFALALVIVFALLWVLRRGEDVPTEPRLNAVDVNAAVG
jgi:exosortase